MVIRSLIVEVAIENLKIENDVLYSYAVSEYLLKDIKKGQSIVVPFGKNNSKRQGVIFNVILDGNEQNLKNIFAVLDEVPLLSDEMLELVKWIKSRYFCTYYEAVKLILPKSVGGNIKDIVYNLSPNFDFENISKEEKIFLSNVLQKNDNCFSLEKIRKLKIKNHSKTVDSLLSKNVITEKIILSDSKKPRKNKFLKLSSGIKMNNCKLTEKQLKLYNFLKDKEAVSKKEIRYCLGISDSVIKTLVKNGIIEEIEFDNNHNFEFSTESSKSNNIILSNEQNEIYKKMISEYQKEKYCVSLIHGVTGSGKTQIILKLIDYVLSIDKSIIFLVPEIALTLQFVNIFKLRYGEKVAVIHSGISDSKKAETWEKIKSREIKIVLGARSAIFAPFDDLGLIVMDEEHESSYKSESSPRFDSKKIARFRCNYNSCMLIFSSATPSIETYYMAKQGKYFLYELNNRYGNAVLPRVEIVDMNNRYNKEGELLFSDELIENLQECLSNKKQAVILLNRRGFNTFVKCLDCGEVQMCPYCSVSLNYHKANNRLMCHYCGYSMDFLDKCISCKNGKLIYMGFGTQRAEIQLQELIPNARILRMDSDTKDIKKISQEDIIKNFEKGSHDILIGTQMISKGFNFPNVTLVGILMVDQYLYSSDFRSYEKAFSLLTQTIGRAGRTNFKGKAIIQTFTPESEIIKLAALQDYKSFFETEIKMRKLMLNPPFSDICTVIFRGKNENTVYECCLNYFNNIKNIAREKYSSIPLRIFSPTSATIKKVADNYRYKIIIKCRNSNHFRDMIREVNLKIRSNSKFRNVSVIVDINPVSIL